MNSIKIFICKALSGIGLKLSHSSTFNYRDRTKVFHAVDFGFFKIEYHSYEVLDNAPKLKNYDEFTA